MSIRMMSGLPARIVAVLAEYLPAELDLIDAEEADSITTEDIAAGNYYQWDQRNIPEYPACSLRVVSSAQIGIYFNNTGRKVDADHRIDVMFHVTIGQDDDPLGIQKLLTRYIAGAVRVLCIMHPTLDTTAIPAGTAEMTTWADAATYGPADEQEDGAIVRTATLPIAIRMIESR